MLQKAYGKTKNELETLVEGFAWALEGHDIEDITQAMRIYIKRQSDIPAPHDIIKIIAEEKKRGYRDNAAISDATLVGYVNKKIPLTPAQSSRLREKGLMSDDGKLTYEANLLLHIKTD